MKKYKDSFPVVHASTFVASGAEIIGDVEIGKDCGIWFNTVVRGDVNYIRIGDRTNIQDGSVVHVTRKTHPTIIGSNVTIGHMALLHGCIIKDNAFIGMKACVMDGAVVEPYAMVAAGALVTPNKLVRSGELWAGSPARFFRKLTDEEMAHIDVSAENYVKMVHEYLGKSDGR